MLAWQHSGLSSICHRRSFECAFYPDKRVLSSREQEQIAFLFAIWEKQLATSGEPYLFGALSLLDLIFATVVLRLFRHKPDFAASPLGVLWREMLLARSSVQEWIAEADSLEHVWYNDYLLTAP